MKLARTIHLDLSDREVFARPAGSGEWAISGGFAFSNWTEADLVGKARQAFANGWLSLESFGRASLVAVAAITADERRRLEEALARHFVEVWGAPDLAAALPVAREEIAFMVELCTPHEPNTLLAVSRELTAEGVRESFRAITPEVADLDLVALHLAPEPLEGGEQ